MLENVFFVYEDVRLVFDNDEALGIAIAAIPCSEYKFIDKHKRTLVTSHRGATLAMVVLKDRGMVPNKKFC